MAKQKTPEKKQKNLEKELASLEKQKFKVIEKIRKKREQLNNHLREQHIKDRYGNEIASLIRKMGPEEAKALLNSTQKQLKEQKVTPERISTHTRSKSPGAS